MNRSISFNDIQLFDKQNRKFIPDLQAMIYTENSFVFETINPGITKKGIVIFDVPDPNAEYKLQVKENILSLFD